MFKRTILLLILISMAPYQSINSGSNGGSIAAGVLGGFGAGAIIGAAATSSRRPREVVYVQDYPPVYNRRSISANELRLREEQLNNLEDDLIAREEKLNRREESLNKRAKNLANKEREFMRKKKEFERKQKKDTDIKLDEEK